MSGKFPEIAEWIRVSNIKLASRADQDFLSTVFSGRLGPDFFQEMFNNEATLVATLDDDALFKAVLELVDPLPISPELYFYVLVRRALLGQSIKSVDVANYITSMLSMRVNAGKQLAIFYVMDAMQQIQCAESNEQFYLRIQFANEALFLGSLFGDYIEHRRSRRGAPSVDFYDSFAETQYLAAQPHPLADEFKLKSVLNVMGNSFVDIRKALNIFKDKYISLGEPFIDDGGVL